MKKKITITIKKPSTKIDLRQLASGMAPQKQAPSTGKKLILEVMGRLIEHTEKQLKSTTGSERQKNSFRVSQFKKAMASIQASDREISSGKEARELAGIGKGIGDRVDEILRTGTLAELAEEASVDEPTRIINLLTTVTGIGEVNARKFVDMGVTGIDDLRVKVARGEVKLTHHMDVGLRYYEAFQQKIPFEEIADLGRVLKQSVHALDPELRVEVCGSHRRLRPLSGDIDVLMTHQAIITDDDLIKSRVPYLKSIVAELKRIGFIVEDLTSLGNTKYMGVCVHPNVKIGRRIDIRFVTMESFYPALLYFTGSMMCNKLMRIEALKKGYTLNEYGLYRLGAGGKEERIIVHSEQEVFEILGLVYLEPHERDLQ